MLFIDVYSEKTTLACYPFSLKVGVNYQSDHLQCQKRNQIAGEFFYDIFGNVRIVQYMINMVKIPWYIIDILKPMKYNWVEAG